MSSCVNLQHFYFKKLTQMIVFPLLLQEDDDFDEEVGQTKFPTIIGVTESVVKIDRLALAIEGQTLLDGSSFPFESVFFAMHQCYYVFNMEYPKEYKNFFGFIDNVLLGLSAGSSSAANRITLQKFVQNLNSLATVQQFVWIKFSL